MKRAWIPPILTAILSLIIVGAVLVRSEGDPLSLARIGTFYSEGEQNGSQGYDGQFVYYIARNPQPDQVRGKLDVPAYRYQRILLPLLAHVLSFSDTRMIPWVIPGINILAHILGTWGVALLLKRHHRNPIYAVYYGLWAGFLLALRLDLPEPLAYSLIVFAVFETGDGRHWLGWVFYALAIFAKEVVIIFAISHVLVYLTEKEWSKAVGLLAFSCVPFGLFQVWLKLQFGQFGVGSGGAMATPFEWIPFMGLLKIGGHSLVLLLVFLVTFGPFVLYPALWGLWRSVKWIWEGETSYELLALGFNAVFFLFLPFSTYREPGGLLRFASGLILALILYIRQYDLPPFWKYAPVILVLNLFLLEV